MELCIMTDLSALKPSVDTQNSASTDEQSTPQATGNDIRANRAADLKDRAKAGLGIGALKIRATESPYIGEETPSNSDFPRFLDQNDDEPVLMLNAANEEMPMLETSVVEQLVSTLAAIATAAWFAFYFIYAMQNGGINFEPSYLGAFFAGLCAPPALLWMMISSMRRQKEVNLYAGALRSELQSLLFPSEENAQHINKDVKRLCEQAAEVSAASKAVLKSLHRARQGLRVEIRDFSGVSKKAEFHIDRLAESLNDRVEKLKMLTDEIEERTAQVEVRTQAGAESWAGR